MKISEKYRSKALDCEKQARDAKDYEIKYAWSEVAIEWHSLQVEWHKMSWGIATWQIYRGNPTEISFAVAPRLRLLARAPRPPSSDALVPALSHAG